MQNEYYEPPETVNLEKAKDSQNIERPKSITYLCYFFFFGMPLSMLMLFVGIGKTMVSRQGDWYYAVLVINPILSVICFIYIWQMRRIGVYAYLLFLFANQIFMYFIGEFRPGALVLLSIVPAILLSKIKLMR